MKTPLPRIPRDRDEADLLAAEYVLGVLDSAERARAEALLRTDVTFALRVRGWEERLAGLDAEFAPVPAPDLMPAIEARLFGGRAVAAPVRRRWRGLAGWLSGAVTAAALAAAVVVLLPGPVPAPGLAARIATADAALAFAAAWDADTGALTVTRVAGAAPPPGQDHELWLIAADGVPVSLGLLRGTESVRALPGLAPGMVLAVSLEAAGGSVSGAPATVLATGAVATAGSG
jgi:anti-sigma-K factor RskA